MWGEERGFTVEKCQQVKGTQEGWRLDPLGMSGKQSVLRSQQSQTRSLGRGKKL